MSSIKVIPLDDRFLLKRYAGQEAYTDCFVTVIPGSISLENYALAFYTTPLFKLERWILDKAINMPSTDQDAIEMLQGTRKEFAAWYVEDSEDDQLLMCDFRNRTRHCLRVASGGDQTHLYFGSAVVLSAETSVSEKVSFYSLLWFHKLYSIALLYAARQRLLKSR